MKLREQDSICQRNQHTNWILNKMMCASSHFHQLENFQVAATAACVCVRNDKTDWAD